MSERGHTLLEVVLVVAMVVVLAAVAVPNIKAYSVEAHLLGAGRIFKGEFWKARSMAVRSGCQTALRFERRGEAMYVSVYADGNRNGVRAAEVASGLDRRVAGPVMLASGAPGVRVGINPGVPAIPPEAGILDPADPIRFGRADMLSFSPIGTATPGTFYLAGEGIQAGVRVNGESARVRLMVCRGGRWRER